MNRTSCPGGRPWFAILGAIAPFAVLGCAGEPARVSFEREMQVLETEPWADPGRVLARVNGVPITRGDYYLRILRKFGSRTMLYGILKEELFLQEARRRGISVSAEEVQAKVQELVALESQRAGGEEKLAEIYRREGVMLEDLRRDYARDVESHLIAGKVTVAMRSIDEALLRTYYSQTYAKARRRVRHIAYSFPIQGASPEEMARQKALALERAARTVKRIRGGADFAETARQESEDATRSTGGDMGYLSEDMVMEPGMKNTVLQLKVGEVSDPVENSLRGAYHVVQVTEIVPHESFAESEARMKEELAAREPDLEEIQEALERLRRSGELEVLGMELERPWEAEGKGRR